MNEVTVTVQLSTAVITEQLFFLAHKTSGMLLQSPPHSVHSRLLFFIVYQLLGNFTLWRRRKKRRSPRRTHLYSSGSLSRRLWRCSRCISFVGFTLIQLPERTLQERIIITEKNKSRSSLSNSFVRLIFRFFQFPTQRVPTLSRWTTCQYCACTERIDTLSGADGTASVLVRTEMWSYSVQYEDCHARKKPIEGKKKKKKMEPKHLNYKRYLSSKSHYTEAN